MMMVMTKSLKVVWLIPLAILGLHYLYMTNSLVLESNRWLISEMGQGEMTCSDTSPFEHVELKDRGQTWHVQYRVIDVILTIEDPKTHEMACRYNSK